MQEFSLIDWIHEQAGPDGGDVLLGIGDDAAVLEVPRGEELVVTSDTLNPDVHFSSNDPPESVGHKALAVNLSDLAAMGAVPRWTLLALSLPVDSEAWTKAFVKGFLSLASAFGVRLVGGDTSSGTLSIGVTALGTCRRGKALRRGGARAGDLVVVSGTLGDAAFALWSQEQGRAPEASALDRLRMPLPRVSLGAALVEKATACVDISDGLLADLGHIASASGLGATVYSQRLPTSAALGDCSPEQRRLLQLAGGDDYELCFTWPNGAEKALAALSEELGIRLTVVGEMETGTGVRCIGADGQALTPDKRGYTHRL